MNLRPHKNLRRLLCVALAMSVSALLVSGCGGAGTAEKKPAAGEQAASSASGDAVGKHTTIGKKEQKEIENATIAALKALEAADGDGTRLGSNMMGDALRDIRRDLARDAAANKVKIRRYGDPKAEWVNYTSGLAGVTVSFIDQGYYVDAVTKKVIAPPSNKSFRFIFTLKQEAGTWKVAQTFESDTARGGDPKVKQDGTINKGTRTH